MFAIYRDCSTERKDQGSNIPNNLTSFQKAPPPNDTCPVPSAGHQAFKTSAFEERLRPNPEQRAISVYTNDLYSQEKGPVRINN